VAGRQVAARAGSVRIFAADRHDRPGSAFLDRSFPNSVSEPRVFDDFIEAIHNLRLVEVVFSAKKYGGDLIVCRCAPMDYGPTRIDRCATDRYHLWVYENLSAQADGWHPLMPIPHSVATIDMLDDGFDPGEFLDWPPSWWIPRDWGSYS
jgi:hypothetical protein